MHLDHSGKPCPSGGYSHGNNASDDEDAWEDVEDDGSPPHLARPQDRSCLTVVHTNGHFFDIWYCSCDGSEDSHLQLMMAGLFPATTKSLRTAFTFQVLDDFIWNIVECGTTAMNYYSKLQRLTSNAFPHVVPVSEVTFC